MDAAFGRTAGRANRVAHTRPKQDQPAVLDVRGDDRAVRQQHGVIGMGEPARAVARHADRAVAPDDAVRRDIDQAHRVDVLLRHDDPAAVRREERVVGEGQARAPGPREAPDDAAVRVDHEEPVVRAVGDQHVAREGRRVGAGCEVGPSQGMRERRRRPGLLMRPPQMLRRRAWSARVRVIGRCAATGDDRGHGCKQKEKRAAHPEPLSPQRDG
jgi:hypothetical protein